MGFVGGGVLDPPSAGGEGGRNRSLKGSGEDESGMEWL